MKGQNVVMLGEALLWRTLTQSILHTLKSLIWAVVLLLLIVYTLLETNVCTCVFVYLFVCVCVCSLFACSSL